jgi:hypothetical protein
METRSWFRLLSAPEGKQLEALLGFAAARRAHYPTFLLVQRDAAVPGSSAEPRGKPSRGDLDLRAQEFIAALEPHLITEATTDRWPGVVDTAGSACVRFYRLDAQSARTLARIGSLGAFAPPLPEDLCLLTNDKTPWLVSSTRANRFHLLLTGSEQRALAQSLPWLQLVPESDPPHSG